MYQCACCGKNKLSDRIQLIIMPTLATLRICTDCLDFLWQQRNPDKIAEYVDTPAGSDDRLTDEDSDHESD